MRTVNKFTSLFLIFVIIIYLCHHNMINMTKLKLDSVKDEIISLYNLKTPISIIAKKFECYPQPVINLLKRYNVYNPKIINQGNVRYFQNIDSNIKAYFFGFITADGCIKDNGSGSKGLSITIHRKDQCILDKLKSEIGCDNPIMYITTKMSHSEELKDHVRLNIFNRDLYEDLCNLGLTERKSTTMPSLINNIDEKFRNSFILGYFDGDGCVHLPTSIRNLNSIVVSFRGTHDFLADIPKHLNIDSFSLNKDKSKNCSSLSFSARSNVIKFFNIYNDNDFFLTRKYNKFLQRINKV